MQIFHPKGNRDDTCIVSPDTEFFFDFTNSISFNVERGVDEEVAGVEAEDAAEPPHKEVLQEHFQVSIFLSYIYLSYHFIYHIHMYRSISL